MFKQINWGISHQPFFFMKPRSLAIIGLTFLSACGTSIANTKPIAPKEAVPVVVVTASQKTVPLQVQGMGTVEAYSTVSVKSRVDGEIKSIYFTQGDDVKKGDLLFKMDARPFEAALSQAQATLAKDLAQVNQAKAKLAADKAQVNQAEAKVTADMAQIKQAQAKVTADMAQVKQSEANLIRNKAQSAQAESEARRYAELVTQGVISKNQYDQYQSNSEALNASSLAGEAGLENAKATVGQSSAAVENAKAVVGQSSAAVENAKAAVEASAAAVENAEAVVQADLALVENAKVNLSYTSIYAPDDGRAGSILTNSGNVVEANKTPLVELKQINPIYVTFPVPQQQLPLIRQYMDSGNLKVKAIIPKSEKNPLEGTLTFIDNAVDSSTGTVKLKATFDNLNSKLWPGLFVNVILDLSQERNTLVVPSQAIQTGQKGQYVFVVKPDLSVENRSVVVSRTVAGEAVIEKGIEPGEKIVIDGQLRLKPGSTVKIKEQTGGDQS